jgi:hypothetical protein
VYVPFLLIQVKAEGVVNVDDMAQGWGGKQPKGGVVTIKAEYKDSSTGAFLFLFVCVCIECFLFCSFRRGAVQGMRQALARVSCGRAS